MPATLPALRSGDLRHQIQVWRKVSVNDGRGGRSTEWQKVASPWAEVLGQNGREAVLSQALQSISVYRIRVRGATDIEDADQVRYQTRAGPIALNVKSVADPNGDGEQKVVFVDTTSVEALPDA